MKHLKRYDEGFLDYFKKDTDEDKVALEFIKRLEKVKDINPYEIKKREISPERSDHRVGKKFGKKITSFDKLNYYVTITQYAQRL